MSARPDISFIIPVYNKADVLPHVLERLAAQDLPHPVEYVFVDDASQDDSVAVIEKHAQALGQIRILRNAENAGPSVRLNQGAREASGKYFCLFDADELIAADAVRTMMALVATERAEMVHGKVVQCGRPAAEITPDPIGSRPPFVVSASPLDMVLQTRGIVRMAWLVEAELFRAAAGCDERIFIQDESLPLRLASKASRMVDLRAGITYAPLANSHLSADTRQQHHDRFFAYYYTLGDNPSLTASQRRHIRATCVSVAWKAARQSSLRVNRLAVLMAYLGARLGGTDVSQQMLDTLASAFRQIDGVRRPAVTYAKGLS